MDRREFVSTTAAALAVFAGGEAAMAQAQPGQRGPRGDGRELYDLRMYSFASADQKARFLKFFKDVEIPGIQRAEVGPVGVFSVLDKPEDLTLYVLVVHRNIRSVLSLTNRLAADTEYQSAGKDFLALSSKDKPYERIDSALLVAFEGMSKLEAPEAKPRIFELRCYESHSATFNLKKIDMFNNGGEIALFRQTGLKPVFFGQMIVGKNMPNLTYMITFDDMKAHDDNWKKFVEHPDWKKLSGDPKYADTVSKIIRTFLKPEDCSQI
ncbi:MAG: NIPSNAP family containing protein [Phycisphaerae bacterium]|nr:NIPSNAP family containing protein [Phycisphaerae bacterium]